MASETVWYAISGKGLNQHGKTVKIAVTAIIEGDGSETPTHIEDMAETATQAIRDAADIHGVRLQTLDIFDINMHLCKEDDISRYHTQAFVVGP